jgi:AcrR family transcriptional regulator
MSPRPRKASDEEVFTAAHRAMSRLGPAQLTLGEIAAEAGLTPGALVQRFGSKRGLLLALAEQSADSPRAMFAGLRAAHASPLAALEAYADCFAQMGESPGALAHHLAYLQIDLTDPEFHRHTRAMARATDEALRELLDAAVAAGELAANADTAGLARAVQVTLSGSLMTWAFSRDGPATDWVRTDLDAVLRPFLAASGPAGERRAVTGTGQGGGQPPASPRGRRRRGRRSNGPSTIARATTAPEPLCFPLH